MATFPKPPIMPAGRSPQAPVGGLGFSFAGLPFDDVGQELVRMRPDMNRLRATSCPI